jgi:hypothetical protein
MRDEWRGEQKKATATRPSLIKIVTFPVPFADRGVACATRVIAPRRSADKKNEAAHTPPPDCWVFVLHPGERIIRKKCRVAACLTLKTVFIAPKNTFRIPD